MARRKKIGDIYKFNFNEEYHCYCQLLNENDVCFYNFYSNKVTDNIDSILQSPELFRILCDQDCFKSEKWIFICNKELPENKRTVPFKYHKAIGNENYSLYRNGVFTKCNREDCIGLELFALWTELGIKQRLEYAFFGKELPLPIINDLPFYK